MEEHSWGWLSEACKLPSSGPALGRHEVPQRAILEETTVEELHDFVPDSRSPAYHLWRAVPLSHERTL